MHENTPGTQRFQTLVEAFADFAEEAERCGRLDERAKVVAYLVSLGGHADIVDDLTPGGRLDEVVAEEAAERRAEILRQAESKGMCPTCQRTPTTGGQTCGECRLDEALRDL